MKHLLLSSAMIALLAGSAMAADLPIEELPAAPEVVAINDWSGVYLGIQGGYSWSQVEYEDDAFLFGIFELDEESGQYDVDGFVGGIYGGANFQFGNWVLGVDSSLSYSAAEGDDTTDIFGTDVEREISWFGTTRARVGYAFGNFLLFGAAGAAIAQTEVDIETVGGSTASDEETHLGWTIGAGVEAKFLNNWSARLEYMYVDLGEEDYDLDIPFVAIESHTDIDMHIVRAGVAYHF